MPIDVGDAVLHFLGDTSQLDQAYARVGSEAQARLAPAQAAIGETSVSLDTMGESAINSAQAFQASSTGISEGAELSRRAMYEAKGEAALLGEMVGIHLPRHVRSFVAELPGVGTLLSGAFAATAVLFLIEALIKGVEKIQEWSQEAHKTALAWDGFNTAVLTSFNGIDEKLLESGIKMDDLRGNHMAALRKELELIDHQSMKELEGEFNILAKAADAMFAQLKASWYEIGAGSAGASNALNDFKVQYELLLAEGKKKEASDLLAGTLKSAKDTLTTMQAAKKAAEEANTIEEQGGGPSEKELKAQQTLITALQAQVTAETKLNELAKDEGFVKRAEEQKKADEEAKKSAEARFKLYAEEFKAREELGKAIKKEADEEAKIVDFRTGQQLKAEEKADLERLQRIHQVEEGRIAAIDGEIKAREDASQREAELLKSQYDRGLITAQQYLARLKALYQQDAEALGQMLNRKQQMVVLEAQNEAAQKGRILSTEEAKELKSYIDIENKKSQIQQQYVNKYLRAEDQIAVRITKEHKTLATLLDNYRKQLRGAEQDLTGFGAVANSVLGDLTGAFGAAISAWLSGQESFGRALEKALAQYLIQVSAKAAIDALYFMAWGIADSFWNPARAGADFAAAAEFAVIASVAGAAGAALGSAAKGSSSGTGTGPAASSDTTASPATAAQAQPVQTVNVQHLAAGGLVTQQTLAIVGEGNAREAVIPLHDSAAMNSIAAAIAKQFGHGGGTQATGPIEIKLHSDIPAVAKMLSRGVSTGRIRLLASNSIRHTRRS